MTDKPNLADARRVTEAATEGPWYWHSYGKTGKTLATAGPVIGGFPTHELNVLKTTEITR